MHDWKSSRHVCRVRWLAHTKALNGPTFGVQGSLNHNLVLLLGFLRFTTFQFQVTRLYFRLLSLSSALRERSGQRKERSDNGTIHSDPNVILWEDEGICSNWQWLTTGFIYDRVCSVTRRNVVNVVNVFANLLMTFASPGREVDDEHSGH